MSGSKMNLISIRSGLIFLILALSSEYSVGQTFLDFINQLNSLPDSLRPAVVDSFMNANDEYPMIEFDTLAHFIYNSGTSSVTVPGDFNGWNPNSDYMTLITGTEFHYKTKTFESDARLDYKFVVSGSNWILDPLNPHTCYGGYGPNSELAMPEYIHPPEILYYSNIPHGAVNDTVFYSQSLNNSRTISIYTPPGYESGTENYPYIIFHDGQEYLSLAKTDNVLDYCIYHDLIIPVIAVFIPPVNRTAEYAGGSQDAFTDFIMEEVIPFIDSEYRSIADPASRATLGPSYGGNISLYLGVTHPEMIGLLAPQSSYVQESIFTTLSTGPVLNLDIYLDAGTYEPGILNPIEQQLIPILNSQGYSYQFEVYHEGHSWGNWKAHVDNALIRFFPGSASSVKKKAYLPIDLEIMGIYPNPFNNDTNIAFRLLSASNITLDIFNCQGQLVDQLVDGFLEAGNYSTRFRAEGHSSGIYYLRLSGLEGSSVAKMVLIK